MEQAMKEFLDACWGIFNIIEHNSSDRWPLLTDRGSFLIKWAEALEAYGTPASFSLGTTFTPATFTVNGSTYDRYLVDAKNNAQRRELMAKQEKYMPKRPLESLTYDGIRLDLSSCFLCENVVQGIDASLWDDIKDNVVDTFGAHQPGYMELYLLPNRYPSSPGHTLTVPLNHDDMTVRQANDNGKPRTYIKETGKTRGNVMQNELLNYTIEACSKHKLVAMRNHVLDGMSIPGHDHFHTFPEELPWVALADRLIDTKELAGFGEGIYTIGNTPWDTLALSYSTADELKERVIPVLANLEKGDVVFTLFLRGNTLLVSPRQPTDTYQQVGAGIPIHYFDTASDGFLARCVEKTPKKGEFDWKAYL